MSLNYGEKATEITIAALQGTPASKLENPQAVAQFYEVIFKKLIEMDRQTNKLLNT